MKRFHVHLRVTNLADSIGFYSKLFGAEPAVVKPDYAKWMLDDPRINFAISTQGGQSGVDHLGIQVDTDEELAEMRGQFARADLPVFDEGETTCCYAVSDKHWTTDPQGIAWESYRSLSSAPTYHGVQDSGCCAPASTAISAKIPVKAAATKCCE